MLRRMQPSKPVRIVVIDDHLVHLADLATLLRGAGYEVAPFPSGSAALASLGKGWPHLVVTDVFMPEMDGFEVLSIIQRVYPTLPVIAISDDVEGNGAKFLDRMLRLGARAAFPKPLDEAEFLRAVAVLTTGFGKR